MGYSISVRFPTPELKDRVYKFLFDHFRNWYNLTGQHQTDACYIEEDDDVAYAPKEFPIIGFNFTSTTVGVEYAWRICTWMAKLIERHRNDCDRCTARLECLTTETCHLAKVNYDACEDIPLNTFHDIEEDGFFPMSKKRLEWLFFEAPMERSKNFNKIVKEELQRLTTLWQSQNL